MNEADKTISICFVASDDYACYVPIVVRSIWEKTKHPLHFYVLGDRISDENKGIVTRYVNGLERAQISFIDFDIHLLDGLNCSWFSNPMPYARLFIPQYISVDKIIYLDLDIIITGDIWEIFNIELDDFFLGAMPDTGSSKKVIEDHKAKLGIHSGFDYFNSGFLLINVSKWRQEKITEKLMEVAITRAADCFYVDQDALNIFFEAFGYLELDPSFNTHTMTAEDTDFLYKGLHYTNNKPYLKFTGPYVPYFWAIAEKTPYYEMLLARAQQHQRALQRTNGRRKINLWKYYILYKISFGKLRSKFKQRYKKNKFMIGEIK